MSDIKSIIQFWFGENIEAEPLQNSKKWFKKDPDFDANISNSFGKLLSRAGQGEFEDWKQTAEGSMAFILLTDQFPRNIYRNKKEAFSFDHLALATSKKGIEKELDKKLSWVMRTFFYLPLEHSESIDDQELSTSLFEKLLQEVPPKYNDYAAEIFEYAAKHWEIIKRFGRFPHRNEVLGRSSTTEEKEFLKLPRSSF